MLFAPIAEKYDPRASSIGVALACVREAEYRPWPLSDHHGYGGPAAGRAADHHFWSRADDRAWRDHEAPPQGPVDRPHERPPSTAAARCGPPGATCRHCYPCRIIAAACAPFSRPHGRAVGDRASTETAHRTRAILWPETYNCRASCCQNRASFSPSLRRLRRAALRRGVVAIFMRSRGLCLARGHPLTAPRGDLQSRTWAAHSNMWENVAKGLPIRAQFGADAPGG